MIFPVENVLSRLQAVSQTGDGQWEARCPCHDDNRASLSIGLINGTVLIHCHAGCPTNKVLAAIQLTARDLFPPREKRPVDPIITTYDYRDETGTLVFQVLRRSSNSKYKFTQRRPDPSGGWINKTSDIRKVLYRLPELLAAPVGTPVIICEGEKDADRVASLGLIATTNPGGASDGKKSKWRPDYSESLRGRSVVILPDNDVPGQAHAQAVAKSLYGIAVGIRVVNLPGLPKKGDVSDWLNAGGTVDQLRALVAETPDWTPEAAAAATAGQGDEEQRYWLLPDGGMILNATMVNTDGEVVESPVSITEIAKRVWEGDTRQDDARWKGTGDWPRRVGSELFAHAGGSAPVISLPSPASFFAWLQGQTGVLHWARTRGSVPKEEFFSFLKQQAREYKVIEHYPHEPTISSHYYACQFPSDGNGSHLGNLVDRFSPATKIDRELIKAMFATAIWGGPGGSRPCFLITADSGRGAGKSFVVHAVGHLLGGCIPLNASEDYSVLMQRLLSSESLAKRVALLDNVKSLRFSWSELESLITSPSIGGKKMYVGEASRPNTLLWAITLNGAALSTDMAQRCVVIKLSEPNRQSGWANSTLQYITDHRAEIIGDLIAFFKTIPQPLRNPSRWETWESEILSRLSIPEETQRVILERQNVSDVEREEVDLIEEYFAGKLAYYGVDPNRERIHLSTEFCQSWFNACQQERHGPQKVSRILGQFIDEKRTTFLRRLTTNSYGRGFEWAGETSSSSIRIDLKEMVAFKMQQTEDSKAVRNGNLVNGYMPA